MHAIWDALFADLRSAALLAALGGTIVAVLAAGTISSRFPAVAWRAARRVAGSPAPRCGSRAAALIALGAALVVEPALVGRALVIAGGVLVALVGARSSRRRRQAAPRGPGARRRSPLAGAIVAVLALTAVAVAIVLPGPNTAALSPPP